MLVIVSIVLIATGVILGVLLPNTTPSKADTDGDFEYTVSGSNATITDYTGSATELIIPSTLGGYTVTSIGNSAFYNCTSLTSVEIPNTVTSIGDAAFQTCYNLASVTIPDTVTYIGGSAFWRCGLTSIDIPNGVTSIGSQTFYGCQSLTSVTIPDSVTSIGDSAFYYCTNLTSIVLPSGITSIGNSTFQNCTNLLNITIPNGVTRIGINAFYLCSSQTSITIPESVTSFAMGAFAGCTSLTSVYFYNNIANVTFENNVFVDGNSNVTYYFKDQTSLNSAENWSSNFTNSSSGSPNFQLMTLNINITVESNNENLGTVSNNSGMYMAGTSIIISATPNEYYTFLGWSLDGGNSIKDGTENQTSYTVNITTNATYTAVFRSNTTIIITTNDSTLGQVSVNNEFGNSITVYGSSVQNIIAVANRDSTFLCWTIESGDSTSTSYENPLNLNNITADTTVTAVFSNGLVEGIAVSVQYQGSETNLAVAGSAKILGYTTTNGLETVNVVAQAYTDYTFLGWQVDGEYITYQDESGQTITLQGYDYISASIPLSVIDGKQIFAVFTSSINTNNGQTDSGNSGVL